MSYSYDNTFFSLMRFRPSVIIPFLCLTLVACQGSAVPVGSHVTIGIQTSPAMALVMVAKDEGLFEAQGLDVELKEFTAGKFALEAFLAGSLDFAVSGDVPAALAAMQGHRFVVPAQVVRKTVNEVRVVAKRDEHAGSAREYFTAKKRALATSIGGGPEFFTYEFLHSLGLSSDDVDIVSQKPGDMPAALVTGSVDAIAIFDPFAFIAERQLGKDAVTFTDGNVYSELYVIEAPENVDAAAVEKLLHALTEAESFLENSPDEAKEIVMRYTGLDRATIDGIWSNFDFHIALTPELLEYWDREAAWAKDTGKVASDAHAPDFASFVMEEPLERIAPERVGL